MRQRAIGRRGLLAGAAGAAITIGPALAGCSTSTEGRNSSNANSDSTELPTYVPYDGVKPDLEPDASGVMAGYFNYPRQLTKITDGKPPGAGSTIDILTQGTTVSRPLAQNAYWRDLHDRLGAKLTFTLAPSGDYNKKLATVLAGGDLPEAVTIKPGGLPRLPDVLDHVFQDLTEYLAGDSVKDYPSLAAIQPQAWENCVYNGRIYGVPIHRGVVGDIMMVRQDIADKAGVSTDIASGDEFVELCRALAEPRKNRWALANPGTTLLFVREMLDAPNLWRVDNGKFTSVYETEEIKESIDVVTRLWKEGLMHPDSFTDLASLPDWFSNGTIRLHRTGYGSWLALYNGYAQYQPEMVIKGMVPPRFSGGGDARIHLSRGCYSFTALKKNSGERIEEILRVANWLAAPFGTEEYMFRAFGTEGRDFSWVDNKPIRSKNADTVPLQYAFQGNSLLTSSEFSDAIKDMHAFQKSTVPNGKRYPTLGLYSAADDSKGAALDEKMWTTQYEIVQGRKSLADWDIAVRDWKTNGGETIRAEYEKSYQENNGR